MKKKRKPIKAGRLIPKAPGAKPQLPDTRPPGSFPSWKPAPKGEDTPEAPIRPKDAPPPKVALAPVPYSGGHAEFVPETVAKGRLGLETPSPYSPPSPLAQIPTTPLDKPDELRDRVLEFIAAGGSLQEFTKSLDAPSMAQVIKLFASCPEYQAALEAAQTIRADILFDDIVRVADSDIDINRAKVMIDARKYAVERLNQKKYSLKHEITGELGLTINVKRFGEDGQWKKEA